MLVEALSLTFMVDHVLECVVTKYNAWGCRNCSRQSETNLESTDFHLVSQVIGKGFKRAGTKTRFTATTRSLSRSLPVHTGI